MPWSGNDPHPVQVSIWKTAPATVAPSTAPAAVWAAVCQVGVSLHAVCDTASVSPSWRLYLPREWTQAADPRRARTGVPDQVGHRQKWRPALDMVDQARSWGLQEKVVVADTGYGQNHPFRHGLAERGLDYVVAVPGGLNAPRPGGARNGRAVRSGPAPAALPHPGQDAAGVGPGTGTWGVAAVHVAAGLPWGDAEPVPGPRRASCRCRGPPGGRTVGLGRGTAGRDAHRRVAAEYWLSSLPADTVLRHLVRLAKIRWRIEHDYRDLKHGLGLDHYEGRTWRGRHHHVTLVSAEQAFLTLRRPDPKRSTSV
ncbi:transposase [Nocardiopsis sp. CC223A]|uniref:IS701 family transposase n=1 Tax=Nocardiopsis sp. CC223A TaxID=3044051 RepID=UPI0027954AA6|nr:transposase [Nocardiopsis sp. CC223A]